MLNDKLLTNCSVFSSLTVSLYSSLEMLSSVREVDGVGGSRQVNEALLPLACDMWDCGSYHEHRIRKKGETAPDFNMKLMRNSYLVKANTLA